MFPFKGVFQVYAPWNVLFWHVESKDVRKREHSRV